MQWLQPKEIIKEVLVPIAGTDNRPYAVKWEDEEYLKQVASMATNNVFIAEALKILADVRDSADNSPSPDYLKGCQEGIKAIKKFLTLPEIAKRKIKEMEEFQKNAGEGYESR